MAVTESGRLEVEALRSVRLGLARLSQGQSLLTARERQLWIELQHALSDVLSGEKDADETSHSLFCAYASLEACALKDWKIWWRKVDDAEILAEWLLGRVFESHHPFLVECERCEPDCIPPPLIELFRRDLCALESLAKPRWRSVIKKNCEGFFSRDWDLGGAIRTDSTVQKDRQGIMSQLHKQGNWAANWRDIGTYVYQHYLPPFNRAKVFSIQHEPALCLRPIYEFDGFDLEWIEGNERRIEVLLKNTRYFLEGHKAHNVLIWGPRGGGKSSLIRGLIDRHAERGLRAIEIVPEDYCRLSNLFEVVRNRRERFIGVLDNISLDRSDRALLELSRVLEGGLASMPDNLIFYATSNYKDLVDREGMRPQGLGIMQMDEDGGARISQGKRPEFYDPQQHHRVDELRALDDRFALKVYVDLLRKEQYEAVLLSYARRAGINCPEDELISAFSKWHMRHNHDVVGGRTARDFIRSILPDQIKLKAGGAIESSL